MRGTRRPTGLRRPGTATLAAALLLAVGCARSSTAVGARTSATRSPSPSATSLAPPPASPGAGVWIAVFAVADDPSALDAQTGALLPLLGSSIRVSPVQCFRGLPAAAGDGYLIGVVAGEKADLLSLVAKTGRTPLFETHVGELCLD